MLYFGHMVFKVSWLNGRGRVDEAFFITRKTADDFVRYLEDDESNEAVEVSDGYSLHDV